MTDLPNGSVSVDPAGVTRLGDAYAAQLATYERHLQQLEDLRARYEPAWGDDDMGKQFRKQFDSLADTLRGLITSVKNSLDYTSTGLRLNGKAYEKADEDALKAGRLLLHGLNQLKAPALRRTDSVRVLSDGVDDDFAVRVRAEDDRQFYRLLLPSEGLTPAMRRPLGDVKPNGVPSHEVEGHGEYHPGVPPTEEFRVLSDGSEEDQPQEYRRLLSRGESDPAQQPVPLRPAHLMLEVRDIDEADQPVPGAPPLVTAYTVQAPMAPVARDTGDPDPAVPGTPPQDPTEFSHT